MKSEKKTIAVLFGGCSPEYKVSLQSAYAVLTHIRREEYEVLPIGITEDGDWFFYKGNLEAIPDNTWHQKESCIPAMFSPNRSVHGLLFFENGALRSIYVDAAFPVLHGRNGEDGTVQGLLELAGIPVIGCSVLGSAVCMDKDMAHRLAREAGVCVPDGLRVGKAEDFSKVVEWTKSHTYPLFVKPMKAGSSFGISRILSEAELSDALDQAFVFDEEVLIEEGIDGFEVGCAVLGNEKLFTGVPDEIELSEGFFDFTEKYTLKTSQIHVPARLSKEKQTEIQKTAETIYRALGCKGFARVDMFLKTDGQLVFNEVNTIPGCTAHSRYPGMMACAGMDFTEMVDRMIRLAFGE